MKRSVLIFFTGALSLVSCAQNIPQVDVAAVVINSFRQQFPNAADVEWERKGALYEVEFETGMAGKDHTLLMDSLGKISYHKADITEADLPAPVKAVIASQFSGYRVDDVKKIDNRGTVTYKMELKKKPEEWDVIFSADGKLLSKIAD